MSVIQQLIVQGMWMFNLLHRQTNVSPLPWERKNLRIRVIQTSDSKTKDDIECTFLFGSVLFCAYDTRFMMGKDLNNIINRKMEK